MGDIELREDRLIVDRKPNQLDTLALGCSAMLNRLDINHVFVAGYVAILAGRARSTEDINLLIEPLDPPVANRLAATFEREGYWSPAMPLSELHEMLANGDNIWVAPEGQVTPHIELKHARDATDEASLENAIEARVASKTLPIGPLELQIAYKLYLGSEKDLGDAAHLYTLFEETLSITRLEEWVRRLNVNDRYARLRTS